MRQSLQKQPPREDAKAPRTAKPPEPASRGAGDGLPGAAAAPDPHPLPIPSHQMGWRDAFWKRGLAKFKGVGLPV